MGQNQSRATKLNGKQAKLSHNPLTTGGTEKIKVEKASQLQLLLKKCKEQPLSNSQTGPLIDSGHPCKARLEKAKLRPAVVHRGSGTSQEGCRHEENKNDGSRPSSACLSRTSASSLSDVRNSTSSTLQRTKERTEGSPVVLEKKRKVISESESSLRPPPISETALSSAQPAQQSKRKRKQRKTLKSLKLRRGSNSSLVSRRRSSRRKREMTQLSKSWLAVSNNLEELGMDMFRRVADLCPDITRTISGLPEGAQVSTHLLLSHPRARQHARRVMETVGMVVDSYGEFDRVRPLLVMLGRHHAKYGVEERQLMMIGEALIFTLQDHLDEEWTASLADTWASLYAMIYGALLEGIKQRQSPPTGLERGHHLRASFRQAQANGVSPATSSRSSPTGNNRKAVLTRKLSRRNTGPAHKNTLVISNERKISA